jgi:hypothetical protein
MRIAASEVAHDAGASEPFSLATARRFPSARKCEELDSALRGLLKTILSVVGTRQLTIGQSVGKQVAQEFRKDILMLLPELRIGSVRSQRTERHAHEFAALVACEKLMNRLMVEFAAMKPWIYTARKSIEIVREFASTVIRDARHRDENAMRRDAARVGAIAEELQ